MRLDDILIIRNLPDVYVAEGTVVCRFNGMAVIANTNLPALVCEYGVWNWKELKFSVTEQRETPYWLCCGSIEPQAHKPGCHEAQHGHPERCRFGTASEHSDAAIRARGQA